MANIRPPQFGVKKDHITLTTQDPNAVLYVVTPDNKFIPAKADDEGRLELAAVTLDMSDIQIGAVEIKNHDSDDRVQVNTDNELLVESRLHDGVGNDLTSTTIGSFQALDINLVGFGGGVLTEADDDDIADSLIRPTNIVLGYAYDTVNTHWERLNQTGGSLDVNITAGGGGPEVTDAATLAGGLTAVRGVSLNYGWDGSTWERINSSSNRMLVDGSEVTQPISVGSLPLPTGAATSALQVTGNASLEAIDTTLNVDLSTRASEATLSALNLKVVTVDTDDVTITSSVLPTGAATEATQALLLTESTFAAEDFATEVTLATMLTEAAFEARINTLGQKVMAASTPVVIASDQTILSVNSVNLHVVDSAGDTYVAGTTQGSLVIGRVIDVDSIPALTIGQISGLTLDINGSLRVIDGNPDSVGSPQNATENDQAFSTSVTSFNLGSAGTETPVMLIRNPSASTVTFYLSTLSVNNDVKTQSARIVIYKIPTVTVTGSSLTPSNFKIGSAVLSQITPFSGPTVSSNGTQLATFATGANQNDLRRTFDFAIILPPNTDMLITGVGSNNNTLIALSIEWAEV